MSDLLVDITYTVRIPLTPSEEVDYRDEDESASEKVADLLIGRAQAAIRDELNGRSSGLEVSSTLEVDLV